MHPTLLGLAAPRTRDSNGDGFRDFEATRQYLDCLCDMGISGSLLSKKHRFLATPWAEVWHHMV